MAVSELHVCQDAYEGNLESVKEALAREASLARKRDRNGRTALHWACSSGQSAVLEFLLHSHKDEIEVDVEDDVEWTPLMIASSAGHVHCVKQLLCAGASVDSPNANGQTSLHYAASRNRLPIITLLLESGASTLAQDKLSSTALHRASSKGNVEATRLLLESKADPNSQDCEGNTPLHLAMEEDHGEIYKLLLAAGGRADITNKEGKTAVYLKK